MHCGDNHVSAGRVSRVAPAAYIRPDSASVCPWQCQRVSRLHPNACSSKHTIEADGMRRKEPSLDPRHDGCSICARQRGQQRARSKLVSEGPVMADVGRRLERKRALSKPMWPWIALAVTVAP